jgi:hypothetical protein
LERSGCRLEMLEMDEWEPQPGVDSIDTPLSNPWGILPTLTRLDVSTKYRVDFCGIVARCLSKQSGKSILLPGLQSLRFLLSDLDYCATHENLESEDQESDPEFRWESTLASIFSLLAERVDVLQQGVLKCFELECLVIRDHGTKVVQAIKNHRRELDKRGIEKKVDFGVSVTNEDGEGTSIAFRESYSKSN